MKTIQVIWITCGVVILLALNIIILVYIRRKIQLYQYLSKDEVNKFRKGVANREENSENIENTFESNLEFQSHYKLPYNKEEYEIGRKDFKISK